MTAFHAILISIALHVVWNLLARHVPIRQQFIWWALLGHLLLMGPWAIYGLVRDADWNSTLVTCMAFSGSALAAYFLGLRLAYRHAPVSLAYPIARSAPLFIALVSWLLFDESFDFMGASGIIVSSLALVFLGMSAWRIDARKAIVPALIATLGTTTYSLSDKVAVSYLPSFASQMGYISVGYFCAWIALTLVMRYETGLWIPKFRPSFWIWAAGAVSIGFAYVLVVYAMTSLSAAYVVALSNGGIIIAVLLSIFWFKEKEHRWARLFWASVLAIGLAMVAVARS